MASRPPYSAHLYFNLLPCRHKNSLHTQSQLRTTQSQQHTHGTHTHSYTHTHKQSHTHTHTHSHSYAHTHSHIHTHTHKQSHTHTHTHSHSYTHTHTHSHSYTHTQSHTHTHTCRTPGRPSLSPACPPVCLAWPQAGGTLARARGAVPLCLHPRTPRTAARVTGRRTCVPRRRSVRPAPSWEPR